MNRILPVALAALLSSCTSYKDDVGTICDAPDKIGDTSNMKPSEKLAKMGQYCVDNVKTEEGKALLGNLAAAGRSGRGKILRKEAQKVGILTCHLADVP